MPWPHQITARAACGPITRPPTALPPRRNPLMGRSRVDPRAGATATNVIARSDDRASHHRVAQSGDCGRVQGLACPAAYGWTVALIGRDNSGHVLGRQQRNHDYATVHRAACIFCDHGRGLHNRGTRSAKSSWLGPFDTFANALDEAQRTGRTNVARCKVCSPG